jgi:hypothetical protein
MSESGIRVVVFRDGAKWAAQALEIDLCVWADERDELPGRFNALLLAEQGFSKSEGNTAFHGIEPAPKVFFEMWDKAEEGFKRPGNADGIEYEMALCA